MQCQLQRGPSPATRVAGVTRTPLHGRREAIRQTARRITGAPSQAMSCESWQPLRISRRKRPASCHRSVRWRALVTGSSTTAAWVPASLRLDPSPAVRSPTSRLSPLHNTRRRPSVSGWHWLRRPSDRCVRLQVRVWLRHACGSVRRVRCPEKLVCPHDHSSS
jgi:hypothetical protein